MRLTMQQKVQVTAALRFWRAMVEGGGKHPCNHGEVSSLFEEYLPIEGRKLDAFIGRWEREGGPYGS